MMRHSHITHIEVSAASSATTCMEDDGEEVVMNLNQNQNQNQMKPAWLQGLMGETFFGGCGVHENRRKSEKNVFCLHCCLSICPHCLLSHRSHPLLQVRRYVYHDVVRLGDLEKLIDCSYIQPYSNNGAKVIFLKQRPQLRPVSNRTNCNKAFAANICYTCDRILQEPFHFCSLSCKVDHLVLQEEDFSGILYHFDESDFTISQFEGLHMDGISEVINDNEQTMSRSILDDPEMRYRGSSCSNNIDSSVMSCEPEVVFKKKKKGILPGIMLSLSSRRKGAPQRSPLS